MRNLEGNRHLSHGVSQDLPGVPPPAASNRFKKSMIEI